MMDTVRVLRSKIQDLERIIAANESILETEKRPEKRSFLRNEIEDLQRKADGLKAIVEGLSNVGWV